MVHFSQHSSFTNTFYRAKAVLGNTLAVLGFLLAFSYHAHAQNRLQGTATFGDPKKPISGVNVQISGAAVRRQGAITNSAGAYTIIAPAGTYTLTAKLIGAKTFTKTVTITADAPTTVDIALEEEEILLSERVVVVGSRSAGGFTKIATPVPVDIVPLEVVGKLGQPEISQTLHFVAPSFHSVTQSQTDGNDHVDFASLRGLGADQTLVLVNGKRRHTSALTHFGDNVGQGVSATDVNTIPVAAVERVEVLRDGAAAQYGSDAIAGILNFVLKSSTNELNVSALGGLTSRGDGQNIRVDANYGFKLGDDGFVNITAEWRHREPTNRVGRWTGNVYRGNLFNFGDFGANGEYNSRADSAEDARLIQQNGFNRDNVQRIGDSRQRNFTLFVNAAKPLAPNLELYAFASGNLRNGDATAFYRFPADADVSNTAIFPNGYLPLIVTSIFDNAVTIGLRGSNAGWNYDVSASNGSNTFDFGVQNTINASNRTSRQTSFDAGGTNSGQTNLRLETSKLFKELGFAESLNAAFGAEIRQERYGIRAGEEASWQNYGRNTDYRSGSQGFPGYQPQNAGSWSRLNIGAFTDAELNFTKDFLLGAAGRFENYSDFGTNLSGKVTARYKFADVLALRGAVQSGFRAPTLQQIYTNKITTIFVANRPVNSGVFNNTSNVAQALGIEKLKAETSVSYSLGLTVEPLDRLTLTADAYLINVANRIVASGQLSRSDIPGVDAALRGIPDVNTVQFLTNAIDTRTRGLDIVLDYTLPLGDGTLALTGVANFTETIIVGDIRKPASIGNADLFNKQERSWIENARPANKFIVSARYAIGDFAVLARTTRFGEVQSINLFGPDEVLPAAWVSDANISYTFGSVTLSLGGNNIFNTFPPIQDYNNTYFGIFSYSRVAPFGTRGATWYAGLSLRI